VSAEHDAYIVLCNGRDPFNSGCYWIVLGGWPRRGFKSVIRKCPSGVNKEGYPQPPCSKILDEINVSINV
jgi:hypothetical protein